MTRGGSDYRDYDALGLAELVRSKQTSPGELLEEAITRAEAHDARLNFLAQEMFDYGRKKIAAGLPNGPFTGVPFLEKDLHMHLAGYPSGQGSRLYAGYVPDFTSELVKRHEAAGLVIFGKTTTPEFGVTATTDSIAEGPTRNPWNLEHSSGGSSGGAASAVASGVIPAAHATDGGGSIRIPASACGLFGLKPSRGRMPMGPLRTEGWGGASISHAVTRSVRDSAALLDVTHGTETGSRYSAPEPGGTFLYQLSKQPRPLRIALMLEPISRAPVDEACIKAARDAARLCESLGHHVEETSFNADAPAIGQASFALISTALAIDIDARAAAIGVAVDTNVIEPITLGFYQVGKQTSGMAVAQANNTLQEAAIVVSRFMDNFDIILSPTLAAPPAPLGVFDLDKPDFQAWGMATGAYTPFAGLFNSTGQPSMSVPLGMSEGGLPIGSMFTARYGDEATLFQLAGQLETAQPWFDRVPII
ncbi:MAG: amidase family protein [Pontixanthobacter sp.]